MIVTRSTDTRSNAKLALSAAIAAGIACGSCDFGEIPPCPGQCFEYTLEIEAAIWCQSEVGDQYTIAFTGSDPDGYRGQHCFNSTSVVTVRDAIDHIHSGGQLSDLSDEVVVAYVTTVEMVRDNLRAECVTAAPGQCTNAIDVCTGIASDMYEELVVDQTCVLGIGGVERVEVESGQTCEPIGGDPSSGDEPNRQCSETTASTGGLDETNSGSTAADQTSGSEG